MADWDRSDPRCYLWGIWRLTRCEVLGKQKWQLWEDHTRRATFLDPAQALAAAVEVEHARTDAWVND